jgi:hypothetical protein
MANGQERVYARLSSMVDNLQWRKGTEVSQPSQSLTATAKQRTCSRFRPQIFPEVSFWSRLIKGETAFARVRRCYEIDVWKTDTISMRRTTTV